MDDISLAADLVRDAGTMASEMLSQGLETATRPRCQMLCLRPITRARN